MSETLAAAKAQPGIARSLGDPRRMTVKRGATCLNQAICFADLKMSSLKMPNCPLLSQSFLENPPVSNKGGFPAQRRPIPLRRDVHRRRVPHPLAAVFAPSLSEVAKLSESGRLIVPESFESAQFSADRSDPVRRAEASARAGVRQRVWLGITCHLGRQSGDQFESVVGCQGDTPGQLGQLVQ
jgi:hypothetical protein